MDLQYPHLIELHFQGLVPPKSAFFSICTQLYFLFLVVETLVFDIFS